MFGGLKSCYMALILVGLMLSNTGTATPPARWRLQWDLNLFNNKNKTFSRLCFKSNKGKSPKLYTSF